MSANMMMFPDTWEEFEQSYGFNDREQIYTNGSRLIQSFRVKQWLDHVNSDKGCEQQDVDIDVKIHGLQEFKENCELLCYIVDKMLKTEFVAEVKTSEN